MVQQEEIIKCPAELSAHAWEMNFGITIWQHSLSCSCDRPDFPDNKASMSTAHHKTKVGQTQCGLFFLLLI